MTTTVQVDLREPQFVNIGQNKSARQSSYSTWSKVGESEAALTGRADGQFTFHTELETDAWWEVDLGEIAPVRRVTIYNRAGHGERALPIRVAVSSGDASDGLHTIHSGMSAFGDVASGNPLVIALDRPVMCRRLRITKEGIGYLHLDQVFVLADAQELFEARAISRIFEPDVYFSKKGQPYRELKLVYDSRFVNHTTPPRITALIVRPFGRFGNFVLQIDNAVAIAQRCKIPRVFYDPAMLQSDLFAMDAPYSVDGVELRRYGFTSLGTDVAVEGTFFYLDAISFVDKARQFTDRARRYSALYGFLQEGIRTPLQDVSSQDIIVHIRGGDVFSAKYVNPEYVQPPLAFYQLAIEEAARSRSGTIRVLFEDRLNPTVDNLCRWLKQNNYRFVEQSSSFSADLRLLFSAATIIASYGTLIPAVARMSPRLRSVFCFDNLPIEMATRDNPAIRLTSFTDKVGRYPKQGEWKATSEQLAALNDYKRHDIGPSA